MESRISLNTIRRGASVFCGIGFLALAVRWSALAIQADNIHKVIGVVGVFIWVLVLLGVGLLMSWRWAGRGAAALLVLWAIFVPVGLLNPFTSAAILVQIANEPQKLLWLVPLELSLLGMAWLVDPPRKRQPDEPINPTG